MYSNIIYAIENNQISFFKDMNKNKIYFKDGSDETIYKNSKYIVKITGFYSDRIDIILTISPILATSLIIGQCLVIFVKDNKIRKEDYENIIHDNLIECETIDNAIDYIERCVKDNFVSPNYLLRIVHGINEKVIKLFKDYQITYFATEFFAQCDGFLRIEFDKKAEMCFSYDLYKQTFNISIEGINILCGSLIDLISNKIDLTEIYKKIEIKYE